MHNFNDILEQIKRQLHCPVCGKKYELGEIKLRGSFARTLVIQTICPGGHSTLFVTDTRNPKEVTENKKPIITDEVLDLHIALKKFNGDFEKQWQK